MRVATFLFHDVAVDLSSSGFQRKGARRYTHTPAQFACQLDAITDASAVVAAADEVVDRAVLLTFDDGGASARAVADQLAERGQVGHFFVTTSMIGQPTFLSADDIRAIHQQGHRVGSHSDTHPDIFRDLPFAEMRAEWRRSIGALTEILGEPVIMASVPGGDVSRRVYDSAEVEGLRFLFTSEPTTRPRFHGSMLVVGRFCPHADTPAHVIARLARFDGWGRHLVRRKLKTALKRAAAPAYRRYVRSTVRG